MSVKVAIRAAGLALVLVAGQAIASEPDFEREARLADEIVDAILDGDPEWLQADGRDFLGIYTEADDSRAAIVILHGRGFHPDWADAINPLRVGYYDYIPVFHHAHGRIEAGIAFLREQGHEKVVLLAHSCGVHMALDWIREKKDSSIDAFVGLGMGATDYRQPMHQPFPLDWMRVPVLDLYGANDYPAVCPMRTTISLTRASRWWPPSRTGSIDWSSPG
jgi:hypothetical protein